MKILITGITGLLGSYLAKELAHLGTLHGLKRANSSLNLLGAMADQIVWHEGDVTDFQSLEEAIEDVDIVVHAAGLLPFDSIHEADFLKVNTEGTANVVNAMLSGNAKRLVFISSATALGIDPDTDTINEHYKWTSSELNSPYAVSKHLAELEVWRGGQEGLEVMVFNPTTLLSRSSDYRSSAHIYGYLLAHSFVLPKGNMNYTDIRDASALMAKLIEHAPWNARYIINKESLPFGEFIHHLREVSGGLDAATDSKNQLFSFWKRIAHRFSKQKAYGKFDGLQKPVADKPIVYDNSTVQHLTGFGYRPLHDTLKWALGNKSKTVPV